jgi:hypothetical protein
MFGRRPDATLVRDLPGMRRLTPFVSPRRGDALVFFEHEVEVERALEFAAPRSLELPRELVGSPEKLV